MSAALPERTCVGCRARVPKRELLRFARRPDGAVAMDELGSAPGRGAYVHRSVDCFERAVSRRALPRALRTGLVEGEVDRLRDEFGSLIGEV